MTKSFLSSRFPSMSSFTSFHLPTTFPSVSFFSWLNSSSILISIRWIKRVYYELLVDGKVIMWHYGDERQRWRGKVDGEGDEGEAGVMIIRRLYWVRYWVKSWVWVIESSRCWHSWADVRFVSRIKGAGGVDEGYIGVDRCDADCYLLLFLLLLGLLLLVLLLLLLLWIPTCYYYYLELCCYRSKLYRFLYTIDVTTSSLFLILPIPLFSYSSPNSPACFTTSKSFLITFSLLSNLMMMILLVLLLLLLLSLLLLLLLLAFIAYTMESTC